MLNIAQYVGRRKPGDWGVSVESVSVCVQIGYCFWEQAGRFNH